MRSLGFGFERLGLLGVRAPALMFIVLAVVSAAAFMGLPRLKTDDALSELFRSSSIEFKNYKAMQKRFPVSEFDLLIIMEGQKLLTPETLTKLRNMQFELQFSDAVSGVLSLFSMRGSPGPDGFPPPLIPAKIPTGVEFKKLMGEVLKHPFIEGKFLSGTPAGDALTVFVLSLNQEYLSEAGLFKTVNEVRDLALKFSDGLDLSVSFSGAPVMQKEIQESIIRDRLVYNSAGFLVGLFVCFLFFRRLSLVIIASLPALLAVIWAMGLLGWVDQKLNNFLNVIPPLVMVIAFSDALHMVFSVRRQLAGGADRFTAARHAIKTVGPACVLTSITTSIAMLSLTLTDSGLIRTFGWAAAMATILTFVSVILVVPTLTCLFYRNEAKFAQTEKLREGALKTLDAIARSFANWVNANQNVLAVIGVFALAACTWMHLQLEPHYRLSDQVPDNKESVRASERLDAKLTGAHPLHIMVEYPKGKDLRSDEILDVVEAVHKIHEGHPKVGNVWSIVTLRRWLREQGQTDASVVGSYLDKMPKHLTARFVNEKQNVVLVTGRLPNLDAKEGVPVMRDLQNALERFSTKHPGYAFTVTGLTAVSALQSDSMIKQLNRGLLIAIVIVIAFIGFAFQSVRVALLSILPNMFPIVAAGSVLYLMGDGLEYASVIALTVAFGLAVDDTIHFLTRQHLEEQRHGSVTEAVLETIERIGPVLILTTIVLVLGLAVTIFSELPAMRLFGKLTVLTLSSALIGDLLILPAIILVLGRRRLKIDRKA